MSSTTLKTTFQLRRGTAAEWVSADPILAKGEPGFEIDTYKLKIGDGTTKWSNLNYFGGTFTVSADGKSINLENGIFSIYGFNNATTGQVPTKGADGKIQWAAQSGSSYTAGANIQINNNVISATDTVNVFWCTYNQTTYAEITQALSENKVPMMMVDGAILKFTYKLQDNSYTFSTVFSYGGSYIVGTKCATDNTWSDTMTLLENTEHIDQSLSSSSATDHYPSSACVYNAISTKQDTLVSGTNIKTVNNNSLIGSGNIAIKTYQPYGDWGQDPSNCYYSGTLLEWCETIDADTSTVPGMAYCGTIETGGSSADPPFFDPDLNMPLRAEVSIQVMGSDAGKVICLTTTCMNDAPYHWEATYYRSSSQEHGNVTSWRKWSDVRANPSGTAYNTLNKLSIDGVAYNIPAGKTYTAGSNIDITNDVISATDTKYTAGTNITIDANNVISATGGGSAVLTQELTAGYTIGGITEGKVYAVGTSIEQILRDLFIKVTPTENHLYYGVGTTVPTSVSGMTSVATTKDTLLNSGYTWKNISLNNEYAFLAIDKSLGVECYKIKQNDFALGFTTVDLGDQILYYLSDKATDTGVRLEYSFE